MTESSSQQSIRLENYEMLKALYSFKATFAKTLSFREGDYFILHQTNTKEKNWWQVIDSQGWVGYIPSNYVITLKVEPQFLINFLETSIHNLLSDSNKQEGGTQPDKQDLILRLVEKKRQAELSKKTKKHAPLPPDFTSTTPTKELCPAIINQSESDIKTIPSNTSYATAVTTANTDGDLVDAQNNAKTRFVGEKKKTYPMQSESETKEIHKTISQGSIRQLTPNGSPVKNKNICNINSRTAYQLLDQVRKNTDLSYEMSKVAVTVVVTGLQHLLPQNLSPYFDALIHQLENPLNVSNLSIEETYDANRLKIIFTELTSCKEDSQQRNWMVYEDESIIVEYIKELTSILTNADANVSRHILRQDQYEGVLVLCDYYQMETRWTIRQLLLQSFGVMCSLDSLIVTVMLNGVLPMELARDMRSNPRNVMKLNYSSLLLTMIFSMGEPMPITHLEHLGTDFITFLLDLIENPPDTDLEDQLPDLFINLILSYNLQFSSNENIVISALQKMSIAKVFTEKILYLFNREEDPVRIFDHEPSPPHSVLKLFIDLFSNDATAGLFYTNDIKVLIDIILRQLSDMFPGPKRRQYLELCRRVLRTSSYNEHRHRSEDLLKCFTRIFCEETSESQYDQQLVREISNEFPHFFKM